MDERCELENIYIASIKDDEVRKTLIGLKSELTAPDNKVFKRESIVYLEACFDYAIDQPSSFRHHCYSFSGMIFFSHKKDKKGKLASVKAMYEDEYRYLRKIGKIFAIAEQLNPFMLIKNDPAKDEAKQEISKTPPRPKSEPPNPNSGIKKNVFGE